MVFYAAGWIFCLLAVLAGWIASYASCISGFVGWIRFLAGWICCLCCISWLDNLLMFNVNVVCGGMSCWLCWLVMLLLFSIC
jgi:hypothetical protein